MHSVTMAQAQEVIGRMTEGRLRVNPRNVEATLTRLGRANPQRYEFELLRLQGRAWDHEEPFAHERAQEAGPDNQTQRCGEGSPDTEVQNAGGAGQDEVPSTSYEKPTN